MIPSLFDIIDFLKIAQGDIVCLQEVNESATVGFQVSSLKEELNMYSHFGANVINPGRNYGLVTYSKYPIKQQSHIYLTSKKEQRGMLHSIIKIGTTKLNVLNLHLGLDEEEREIQLMEVVEYIKNLKGPYVVVGDFNQSGIDIDNNLLIDVAKELKKDNVLTYTTTLDRIDYILVSNDIEILSYEVLIKNMSDHYPIVSKIKI